MEDSDILTKNGKIKRTNDTCTIGVHDEETQYRRENPIKDVFQYSHMLKCTSSRCYGVTFSKQIENREVVPMHPHLGVFLCKECITFYNMDDFSCDEDEDEKYCRWCGQGGDLFICSKCICGFCEGCILKNLGRDAYKIIKEDDDWKCILCEPKMLWHLRNVTHQANEYAREKSRKERRERRKKRRRILQTEDSESDNTGSQKNSRRSEGGRGVKRKDNGRASESEVVDVEGVDDDSEPLQKRRRQLRSRAVKSMKRTKENNDGSGDGTSSSDTSYRQSTTPSPITSSDSEDDPLIEVSSINSKEGRLQGVQNNPIDFWRTAISKITTKSPKSPVKWMGEKICRVMDAKNNNKKGAGEDERYPKLIILKEGEGGSSDESSIRAISPDKILDVLSDPLGKLPHNPTDLEFLTELLCISQLMSTVVRDAARIRIRSCEGKGTEYAKEMKNIKQLLSLLALDVALLDQCSRESDTRPD